MNPPGRQPRLSKTCGNAGTREERSSTPAHDDAPLTRDSSTVPTIWRLLVFVSLLLVYPVAIAAATPPEGASTITVFAASSLTDALQALAAEYKSTTGKPVRFSFAASSVLARQIEAGAPVDVFICADTDWMDYVANRNLIDPASRRNVVSNRLVLIAPADSKLKLQISRGMNLAAALGKDGRFAMSDPEAVPVGRYGRAALISLGAWAQVADRVVRTENARATLALVARGEVPLGVVYQSDAKVEPKVKTMDVFPAGTHIRIVYPAALVRGALPEARAFLDFLSRPAGVNTFVKFGFVAL